MTSYFKFVGKWAERNRCSFISAQHSWQCRRDYEEFLAEVRRCNAAASEEEESPPPPTPPSPPTHHSKRNNLTNQIRNQQKVYPGEQEHRVQYRKGNKKRMFDSCDEEMEEREERRRAANRIDNTFQRREENLKHVAKKARKETPPPPPSRPSQPKKKYKVVEIRDENGGYVSEEESGRVIEDFIS